MQPSNSPNGFSRVDAPRRGESYGHLSIAPSLTGSHIGPASSSATRAPAFVSAWAAMPPPAPDPTIQTSYTVALDRLCIAISLSRTGVVWAKRYRRAYPDANPARGWVKGSDQGVRALEFKVLEACEISKFKGSDPLIRPLDPRPLIRE